MPAVWTLVPPRALHKTGFHHGHALAVRRGSVPGSAAPLKAGTKTSPAVVGARLHRTVERLALALLASAALHAIAWPVAARHHAIDPPSEEPIALLVEPAPADPVKSDLPETPSDPVARSPGVRSAKSAAVSRSRTLAAPRATAAPASSAMTAHTGNPLVVGSASAYAGGPTTIPGGSGGDGAGGGHDLSLPARLGGAVQWTCPWAERFNNGINDGRIIVAHVAVEVDVDGSAVRARVTDDPGYGFGRTARGCALQGRYIPGRGADGRIARVWTESFRVIFDGPSVVAAPEKASWETSTAQ